MELYVAAGQARRGTYQYVIKPAKRRANRQAFPKDVERLNALVPRIEAMARRKLGRHFEAIESVGSLLTLNVKVGTSRAKPFEFRDLCGWIALFDAEPPVVV